ncbi:hypothetical protein, partial [Nonomuraea dietziae]|uniref:hypothetical protein n=1 Tax=Nonomuraea dietziae TaxID=65515 RepID=UPI0031DDC3FE
VTANIAAEVIGVAADQVQVMPRLSPLRRLRGALLYSIKRYGARSFHLLLSVQFIAMVRSAGATVSGATRSALSSRCCQPLTRSLPALVPIRTAPTRRSDSNVLQSRP